MLSTAPGTPATGAGGHISLSAVSKIYGRSPRAVTALDGINLEVRRGEFLALLGPSGCGKSTLLMMIAGLIPPSSGTITVAGKPVTAPLTDIGIAFQQDLLFDWRTVLGNVLLQADIRGLDRKLARAKALRLLERVGLAGFEQRRPWELSGGMRQRVAICRALLPGASLLLLDEPFGALDAMTRDQMNLDLQHIWLDERVTAIMVTHSIAEAAFLADRVAVLSPRPGRVVSELAIDLPRPRTIETRDSSAFLRFQRELRRSISSSP